jgi:hypothetical protein
MTCIIEAAAEALYEHWVAENVGREADWVRWGQLGDKDIWRERARAALEPVRLRLRQLEMEGTPS